jgi:hypothetical protein
MNSTRAAGRVVVVCLKALSISRTRKVVKQHQQQAEPSRSPMWKLLPAENPPVSGLET